MTVEPTEPPVVAAPIWPPTPIDKIDRTNTTPARDQHPKDHEDLERAVNAILLVMGQQPYGVSDTLTAELVRLQAELDSVQTTPGPVGPSGPTGAVGTQRFYGEGPPGVLIGARPADEYVDTLTGDLYTLQ